MSDNDLILDEFLIEAGEIFDQLDLDFVALEKNSTDRKLIGSIFRAMHSLKGSSRFCAFRRLERLTHYAESLLGEVREGSIALNATIIDTLLRVSDRLRALIADITVRRVEPDGEDPDLIAELEQLIGGQAASGDDEAGTLDPAPGRSASAAPPPAPNASTAAQSPHDPRPQQSTSAAPARSAVQPTGYDSEPRPVRSPGLADPVLHASTLAPTGTPLAPVAESAGRVIDAQSEADAGVAAARGFEAAAPVRVSVELLDSLMNLVGEMVVARNRLLSFGEQSVDRNFTGTVRTIDTITMALQERMMKTRMQPLGQLWSKFPRLVRDVAHECGKQIDLVQTGGETELDRAMIEGIRDPLMHIIRNCIDHGIEDAALRAQRGKPAQGTISLSASHLNGSVVIEVTDDGGGIDSALVGRKALEKGLISADRLARLSEREVLDLIFVPGFSTRDQVTKVSGRGVGMDVVRNNLQKIGGAIEIATSTAGTRFSLKIPLTLAIMPALFVRVGTHRFAIPQISLFEIVHRQAVDEEPSFERYHDVPVFRLRDRLLPLLALGSELDLGTPPLDASGDLHIVVVQAAELSFGIVVDEVLFMQEVVVKPLSAMVRQLGVYSGATILGDGCVSLILDVAGIAERARLHTDLHDAALATRRPPASTEAADQVPMLLVDLDSVDRVAIPLDYVDRLEMILGSRIEHRGREDVVILGDQIMPLIWVSSFVDEMPRRLIDPDRPLPIVVHRIHHQPIGLVVRRIHDITSVPPMVTMVSSPMRGFLGSAIVDERVVSILDVPGILRAKGLDIRGSQAANDLASRLAISDRPEPEEHGAGTSGADDSDHGTTLEYPA